MLGKIIDNTIGIFSPHWAASRAAYRHQLSQIKAATGVHESMRKMLSGKQGGYEAGKDDRLKGRACGSPHENDLPRRQIHNLRWRSWNLYRNCPQARKICRTLGAKVIGRGLQPQPQTTDTDGTPFVEFRRRARQVWEEFSKECDFRGKPGGGGQHLTVLSKTALRAIQLSGGVLLRFRHLSKEQAKKLGLLVPLQIQLLHVDRLDEDKHGKGNFYGVEMDGEGRPVAYHVLKGGTVEGDSEKSVRVPASEMKHLFAEEDIDQLLGSPWLGASLLTMDKRQDYEYSELIAAEMGSCFVAGYRRSSGHSGGIGLQNPSDSDSSLTDADGNPVTRLQPGMFLDLGRTGELQMVSPNRPNNGAEGFISHLVRSEAVSVPGVKSSTLTGDYRNSSFSSERSADNDMWPEIEEIQDWFSLGFNQPIYEECITVAVMAGLFDGIEGFSVSDFNERKREYLKVNWQGPVARSINPVDDADASNRRVKNAQSTPQLECAKVGTDWRENIDAISEFIAYCQERGVPEDIWKQALGIEQRDFPDDGESRPTEQQQDDATALARLRSGFSILNSAGGVL